MFLTSVFVLTKMTGDQASGMWCVLACECVCAYTPIFHPWKVSKIEYVRLQASAKYLRGGGLFLNPGPGTSSKRYTAELVESSWQNNKARAFGMRLKLVRN